MPLTMDERNGVATLAAAAKCGGGVMVIILFFSSILVLEAKEPPPPVTAHTHVVVGGGENIRRVGGACPAVMKQPWRLTPFMACRSEYGIPELGWSQGTGSRGLSLLP